MKTNLLTKIFLMPWIGWEEVKDTKISYTYCLSNILLPVVFAASLITYLGTILHESGDQQLALKYFAFSFGKWSLTIVISSWAINKLIGGFKGKKDLNSSFLVITVSSSIVVILTSLTHLIPSFKSFLIALSALGLLHYYFGIALLLTVPKERIVGFLLISLLIFALNIFVFEIILALVLNFPIHL
jgi:hypothetical protein